MSCCPLAKERSCVSTALGGRHHKRHAKKAAKPAAQKTKKAILLAAISKPEGITIGQAAKLTGWLENSCRGALSTLGAESFQEDGQERRYRLKGA